MPFFNSSLQQAIYRKAKTSDNKSAGKDIPWHVKKVAIHFMISNKTTILDVIEYSYKFIELLPIVNVKFYDKTNVINSFIVI